MKILSRINAQRRSFHENSHESSKAAGVVIAGGPCCPHIVLEHVGEKRAEVGLAVRRQFAGRSIELRKMPRSFPCRRTSQQGRKTRVPWDLRAAARAGI